MMTEVGKIRLCSNKILPLVYEDSLSYYEDICKLTSKVNELIEKINGGDYTELIEQKVMEVVNSLIPNAIYDAENERIILTEVLLTAGDKHVYVQANEEMSIV